MIANPLVTIAIPAYNGAHLIENAIRSILGQTYKRLEILVIDDNSSDCTADVVRTIQDNRIRFLRNLKNIGLANNFRRALVESKGELICFLSQDDEIDREFVQWSINAFREHPNASFVFAATRFSGDRNGQHILPLQGRLSGDEYIRTSLLRSKNLTFLCGAVARRDMVIRAGIEDYLFFDWTLWLRLASQGDVIYTPQLLSTHRYHAQKATKIFMVSYCLHCKELIRAVDGFADGQKKLDNRTLQLLLHCKQRLYSIYVSLLAHDVTLHWRAFIVELKCFVELRSSVKGSHYRVLKAIVTYWLLKLRYKFQ